MERKTRHELVRLAQRETLDENLSGLRRISRKIEYLSYELNEAREELGRILSYMDGIEAALNPDGDDVANPDDPYELPEGRLESAR